MTNSEVAPYGSWKSPVTSDLIASGGVRFEGQLAIDGEDVYWVESRPSEGGRSVIVRWSPDGQPVDVTAPPFNARTRVHEYGGGSFLVKDGTVYFSNFADQRIYRIDSYANPQPVTPESDLRYADGVFDHHRKRIICVCEDHTEKGREASNYLIEISLDDNNNVQKIVTGNDFYSSPRLSPDGTQLAWLTWNHPDMPWDSTELWVGGLTESGPVSNPVRIAGGEGESICQPEFSPDGILYFVSDRTGWWNLYRWTEGTVQPLCEMEAEFGAPQWMFGLSTYGFESADRIICTYIKNGLSYLARLDVNSRQVEVIDVPYTSIASLQTAPDNVIFIGGSPIKAEAIVKLNMTNRNITEIRRSTEVTIDDGYLSVPQPVEFPTEQGLTAHAFLYLPKNHDFTAPPDERSPLIILSHGGPTSAASSKFSLAIQYWTSRGFTVADVNYGGSSGYGRAYRQRLDGKWGIVDVDDCVNCARYLIERGDVDAGRIIIRGGSAGGYTTLAALTFRSIFRAGASYYGVSDLEALAKETHKFESHYLDRLIGPYPGRRDLYQERSPLNFVDRLSCPVIFFQGSEDRVVPPDQAEVMVDELRRKGVPVSYILFEGEQHGFRKAENIKRALDAELYFYLKIFGVQSPEPIEPVPIDNLE